MENVKILIDGIQKEVYGLFYIFNSKYYFIYTEKELDEKDYVLLYMTQVAKETKKTETGVVDTGFMVGMEITDSDEQKNVQASISYIVEDKKNNTINPQIQYLPMSMLSNLKIVSKKRFRLLKSVMVNNFKMNFDDASSGMVSDKVEDQILLSPIEVNVDLSETQEPTPLAQLNNEPIETKVDVPVEQKPTQSISDNNIIIDYRTKFFEEEEKNKELQAQIDELTKKIEEIKKVLE